MTDMNRAENEIKSKTSQVDHPSHYGGEDNPYEHVKIMEATLTKDEFVGAMKYQITKYLHRLGKKDTPEVGAGKAAWYANRLRDYLHTHKMPWFRDVGRSELNRDEIVSYMGAPKNEGWVATAGGMSFIAVKSENGCLKWEKAPPEDPADDVRAGPGGHRGAV